MPIIYITDLFSHVPSFVLKEFLVLFVTIISGIILGLFTSNVLEKRNARVSIEGKLLERKLMVYEEIHGKLQTFVSLFQISPTLAGEIVSLLEDNGLLVDTTKVDYRDIPILFSDVVKLQEAFFSLDAYLAQKRLCFDKEVDDEIIAFQNYYSVFNRFVVLYEEHFMAEDIDFKKREVREISNMMMMGIAMILKEDFEVYVDRVENAIRESLNHISMKHRDVPDYSYSRFRDENSPIVKDFMRTKAYKEGENIRKFIGACVVLGLALCKRKNL